MSKLIVNDPLNDQLLLAVSEDAPLAVKHLLEQGADPLCPSCDGFTPFEKAAKGGCIDSLGMMLNHGVSIDWQDAQGKGLLHLCAEDGFEDVAAYLLGRGANAQLIDQYGNVPLHFAAMHDALEVAELLHAHGAQHDAVNQVGKKPIDVCNETSDILPLLRAIECRLHIGKIIARLNLSHSSSQ